MGDLHEATLQELALGATAVVQEAGELQVGTGVRWEEQALEVPFAVEYGLTDRLSVEAELPLQMMRWVGVDRPSLGIAWQVVRLPKHALALAAEVAGPSLSGGARAVSPELSVRSWSQLGRFELGLATGARLDVPALTVGAEASAALALPMGRFAPLLEVAVEADVLGQPLQPVLAAGIAAHPWAGWELVTSGCWSPEHGAGLVVSLSAEVGTHPEAQEHP